METDYEFTHFFPDSLIAYPADRTRLYMQNRLSDKSPSRHGRSVI